jgi:hypothetical protein
MTRAVFLRDAARSLSLATLCFLVIWNELLASPVRWPRAASYVAVIVNEFLFAGLFLVAATLVRRTGNDRLRATARWAFLLLLLVPLRGLLVSTGIPVAAFVGSLAPWTPRIGTFVILALGALLLARWHRAITRGAVVAIGILFPFWLFTLAQAAWFLTKFKDEPPAARLTPAAASAPRVLWLVFDEMDQRLSFDDRPRALVLEELDALRTEAIYASNAYPPAGYTSISMPALITGKLITRVRPIGPAELMITYDGEKEPVAWSKQPNVFSRAHDAGFNTAALGWFHPYCRVIGGSLTTCSWQDVGKVPLWPTMVRQMRRVTRLSSRAAGTGPSEGDAREERRDRVDRYREMLDRAKRAVSDPAMGLIMVHWPVPHPPAIYDRRTDELEWKRPGSYLDNLVLVDRTLGELRRAMETSGTWKQTTVLLTSDHAWRQGLWRDGGYFTREDIEYAGKTDLRVPFLLRLAAQETPVTYEAPFNTVLMHDLSLAILRGELRDPQSVTAWLDQHRATDGHSGPDQWVMRSP